MTTRARLLQDIRRSLAASGVTEAEADARLLFGAATDLAPLEVVTRPDEPVDAAAEARLAGFVARRQAGEPAGRILGRKDFWGMSFALSPGALEPRADSEIAVEAALEHLGHRRTQSLAIADLGTGTGCLLAALLCECPRARGVGVELDPGAAATASANLAALGFAQRVRVFNGSWEAVTGPFDLVISNPPYIRSGDIAGLAPEVRDHDPSLALDGGEDGLDAYRSIMRRLPELLAPGGGAVFEIGFDQAEDVTRIARAHGLSRRAVREDLQGHDRALVFAAP